MNINERLLGEIDGFIGDYSTTSDKINQFYNKSKKFQAKQKFAIKIIEDIMNHHGKKELHYQITDLAKTEFGIRKLQPWVRDHVIHAILSFILGIYLNEIFLKYQQRVDIFQWKVSGLFHDVGYPIEIAKDVMNPVSDTINKHKQRLGINRPDIEFEIKPKNLEKLQLSDSFELIQQQLDSWKLIIDARDEYEKTIKSKKWCHGIMSALLVLYHIDCSYQKYNKYRVYEDKKEAGGNWNQYYFENDIVPACSAIFIHNLPERCFKEAKIDRIHAPLPFLLKLVDSLQDWERPKEKNIKGYNPDLYDIYIRDDNLFFNVKLPDRKKEIKKEISSYLIASDIHIV